MFGQKRLGIFNKIHTGHLFDMTSTTTPEPFIITEQSDGSSYRGTNWQPFSVTNRGSRSCEVNVAGRGVKLTINLGRSYKNMTIEYSAAGGPDGRGGYDHGELWVHYSDTNQWTKVVDGGSSGISGSYTTIKDRPIDQLNIRSVYNSGSISHRPSVSKLDVIEWQKA